MADDQAPIIEEDSYDSIDPEEQESYEPPLSYDQENDSVLSFDSENEPRDVYYGDGGHNHAHGGDNGGQMEDFDDYDNMDPSGGTWSDDESRTDHRHQHLNGGRIGYIHHHSMSMTHLPIDIQLWHQVNNIEMDPLELKVISRIESLHSMLKNVASS